MSNVNSYGTDFDDSDFFVFTQDDKTEPNEVEAVCDIDDEGCLSCGA
jgi:hypothetical protein